MAIKVKVGVFFFFSFFAFCLGQDVSMWRRVPGARYRFWAWGDVAGLVSVYWVHWGGTWKYKGTWMYSVAGDPCGCFMVSVGCPGHVDWYLDPADPAGTLMRLD